MNVFSETLDRWMNRIMLQPKLMITFCIISIVPLAITAAFFYFILHKSLEEEVGASMMQTTKQVDERLSSFTEELAHLTKIVQFDSNMQSFLEWESSSQVSLIPNLQALRNRISNIVNQNAYLRGIYAVNDHGKFIHDDKDMVNFDFNFLTDSWYKEVMKEDRFRLLPTHRQNYAKDKSVVTFAGRIFKVSDLQLSGTLLFDYDSQYILNMIENIRVGA